MHDLQTMNPSKYTPHQPILLQHIQPVKYDYIFMGDDIVLVDCFWKLVIGAVSIFQWCILGDFFGLVSFFG